VTEDSPTARRRPWGPSYQPPEVEWDVEPRPASASAISLKQQTDITDSNALGNVHGGVVMKLVDTAGGLAAIRHCGGPVVTVAMDEMVFMEPVFVGDIVTVKAMVNETFRTSLEVGVRVEAENVYTGHVVHTSSAYLVYVALDRSGLPRPVPPVVAENEEQEQRRKEAKLRRESRLAKKQAILKARAERGED
jgi:acyl-CoA hydrolase